MTNDNWQMTSDKSLAKGFAISRLLHCFSDGFFLRRKRVATPANPVPNNNKVAGSGTGAVKPGAEIVTVNLSVVAPVTTFKFPAEVPLPVAPAKIPVPLVIV